MIAKIELVFNRNLEKYKKGDIVKVELNGYWRNRLKDGDVSIKEETKTETKTEIKTEIKEGKKK